MGYPKETYVPFIGGAILGAVGTIYVVAKTIDMQKALEDTVYNWMNHLLGDKPNSRQKRYGSHVNYNDSNRYHYRRPVSYEVKNIILPTRKEAEDVVDRLFEMITQYGSVSIADLYTLVGIEENFDDTKYGWNDLRGVGIHRIRGGYKIDNLPSAKGLDIFAP